jgi:hypothetical protein
LEIILGEEKFLINKVTWQEFIKIFIDKNEDLRMSKGYIYRGQEKSDWGLVPTYFRKIENKLDTYQKHLTTFERALRGKVKFPVSDIEALGQHYGLATRYLDWAYSPFVALFFAFES